MHALRLSMSAAFAVSAALADCRMCCHGLDSSVGDKMSVEDALTSPQECCKEEMSSSFEEDDIDHLCDMVCHYTEHMV